MLLFKSFVAGMIAGIPLAVSLVLMFGFMGFTGVTLDIATALISSIVIGVGVDYTIHFLWRYKIEMEKHNDPVMAVEHSLIHNRKRNNIQCFKRYGGFRCSAFQLISSDKIFWYTYIFKHSSLPDRLNCSSAFDLYSF
jgi:hypothetical protein